MTAAVLAIDPGYAKRGPGCACALFLNRRLSTVWYARPGQHAPAVPDGTMIVWECPAIRPREDVSPGKANTLITLAATGAELAGQYSGQCGGRVVAIAPTEWKGTTAKPVQHGRLWAVLDPIERSIIAEAAGDPDVSARIEAAKRAGGLDRWSKAGHLYYGSWPTHNILDAVGIGRWYVEQRFGGLL